MALATQQPSYSATQSRSRFHDRLTSRALRTHLGLIRWQRDRRQCAEGDVERLLSAASVDDGGGAHDVRPRTPWRRRSVSRVDPPVVTTSSTTSTALARSDGKAAPQRERPILPFGEDGADAERPGHFLPDDDSTEGGREHQTDIEMADTLGERGAARLGLGGVLQHERALQITGAVQAGCQAEVSFEQCPNTTKSVQNRVKRDRSHSGRVYLLHWATGSALVVPSTSRDRAELKCDLEAFGRLPTTPRTGTRFA